MWKLGKHTGDIAAEKYTLIYVMKNERARFSIKRAEWWNPKLEFFGLVSLGHIVPSSKRRNDDIFAAATHTLGTALVRFNGVHPLLEQFRALLTNKSHQIHRYLRWVIRILAHTLLRGSNQEHDERPTQPRNRTPAMEHFLKDVHNAFGACIEQYFVSDGLLQAVGNVAVDPWIVLFVATHEVFNRTSREPIDARIHSTFASSDGAVACTLLDQIANICWHHSFSLIQRMQPRNQRKTSPSTSSCSET